GVVQTLYDMPSLATNMLCLDGWQSGKLIAAWADYVSGGISIATWANVNISTTPVFTHISGTGTINVGKLALVCDETRQRAFLSGDTGFVFQVTDGGALIGSPQVVFPPPPSNAGNQVHYMDLHVDEGGE